MSARGFPGPISLVANVGNGSRLCENGESALEQPRRPLSGRLFGPLRVVMEKMRLLTATPRPWTGF